MPITPAEQRAELREWADNNWLLGFVPRDLPQSKRVEIAQESWLRLAEADPGSIHDLASFRSYARTVVHRATIDITLGKRRRIKNLQYVQPTDVVLTTAGIVTESPDEKCDRERQARWLRKEILALPSRRRRMLELMKLDGLSAKQTAQRLGVTINTVYTEVREAVAYLISRSRNPIRNGRPRRE